MKRRSLFRVVSQRSRNYERQRSRNRSRREKSGTAQGQGTRPNGEHDRAGPYAAPAGKGRRQASAVARKEGLLGGWRLERRYRRKDHDDFTARHAEKRVAGTLGHGF